MKMQIKNPAVVVCGKRAYELLKNELDKDVKDGIGMLTGLPVVINETLCGPLEVKILDKSHPLANVLTGR